MTVAAGRAGQRRGTAQDSADQLDRAVGVHGAQISPEKVLTLNADAIVYSYGNAQEPEAEQRAAIVKLLPNSEAVRVGKVIHVRGERGLRTWQPDHHGALA